MKRRLQLGGSLVVLRSRRGRLRESDANRLLVGVGLDEIARLGVLARAAGHAAPTSYFWLSFVAYGGLGLIYGRLVTSVVLALAAAAAVMTWRCGIGTRWVAGETAIVVTENGTRVIDHRGLVAAFSERVALTLLISDRSMFRPSLYEVQLVDGELAWRGEISRNVLDLLNDECSNSRVGPLVAGGEPTSSGSDAEQPGVELVRVRTGADLRRTHADLVAADPETTAITFSRPYGNPEWWVWTCMFLLLAGLRAAFVLPVAWWVTAVACAAALVAAWRVGRCAAQFEVLFGAKGAHLIDGFGVVPLPTSATFFVDDGLVSVRAHRQVWCGRPEGTRIADVRTLWAQRVITSD